LESTIEPLISQSPPPTSSVQVGQLNAVRALIERAPSFDLSGSSCEAFFSKEALRSVEKEMVVDGFDSESGAALEGRGWENEDSSVFIGEEVAPFNLTGLFFDSFFAEESVSNCKYDCSYSDTEVVSDLDSEPGISTPGLDTESNGEEAAPFNLTGLFFDSFFADDSVSICKDYISFRPRTFRDIPPLPLARGEVFAFELEEVGKESSGPPGVWLRVRGPMSATLCQPVSLSHGGHNGHYPTPGRARCVWRPCIPRPPPASELALIGVPSPLAVENAREGQPGGQNRGRSPPPLRPLGAGEHGSPAPLIWLFCRKVHARNLLVVALASHYSCVLSLDCPPFLCFCPKGEKIPP
jgi:hypothetical protein